MLFVRIGANTVSKDLKAYRFRSILKENSGTRSLNKSVKRLSKKRWSNLRSLHVS